tara:strand:+ start:644 stop:847 length:204 start_codon:yes stop_codon:yes gene_type:complete
MDEYIDILEQAIILNTRELEDNADDYSMSQIFYMRGYTQCLKDVLTDLKENNKNSKNLSGLRKFNLN